MGSYLKTKDEDKLIFFVLMGFLFDKEDFKDLRCFFRGFGTLRKFISLRSGADGELKHFSSKS